MDIAIPIEKPEERFKDFLQPIENQRIFFSGKFGIGKTYFLKSIFENSNKEKVIHLFPVNYQVANNDDIFEYIKYDILFHLISKGYLKFDKDIRNEILFYEYLKNHGLRYGFDAGINFLSALPKIGHAFEGAKKIVSFIKDFNEFKSRNQNLDESTIDDFCDKIEEKGIYEFDYISSLIKETIENESFYLIVDDLDRIDPDHIFRLLNMFSAHFDINSDNNKFGFEKIIFVGDLKNIKSIYKHKYGKDTDYAGYLDKFYNNGIFEYSNVDAIITSVKDILNKLISENPEIKDFKDNIDSYVRTVLIDLIKSNQMNLRKLLNQAKNKKLDKLPNKTIKIFSNQSFLASQVPLIFTFQILEIFFGYDIFTLKNALEKSKPLSNHQQIYSPIMDQLILINPEIEFYDRFDQSFKLDGMEIKIKEVKEYYMWDIALLFESTPQKKELIKNIYHHLAIGYQNYLNIKNYEGA